MADLASGEKKKEGKNLVGWDWDSGWPYYEACGS